MRISSHLISSLHFYLCGSKGSNSQDLEKGLHFKERSWKFVRYLPYFFSFLISYLRKNFLICRSIDQPIDWLIMTCDYLSVGPPDFLTIKQPVWLTDTTFRISYHCKESFFCHSIDQTLEWLTCDYQSDRLSNFLTTRRIDSLTDSLTNFSKINSPAYNWITDGTNAQYTQSVTPLICNKRNGSINWMTDCLEILTRDMLRFGKFNSENTPGGTLVSL